MSTLPDSAPAAEGLGNGYRVVINDGVDGCEFLSLPDMNYHHHVMLTFERADTLRAVVHGRYQKDS